MWSTTAGRAGNRLSSNGTHFLRPALHSRVGGLIFARAHSAITPTGKIRNLSAGKVAIQSRSPKKGWKNLALMRVERDGSFGYQTRVGAPGTIVFVPSSTETRVTCRHAEPPRSRLV